jgi:hypothetical protein
MPPKPVQGSPTAQNPMQQQMQQQMQKLTPQQQAALMQHMYMQQQARYMAHQQQTGTYRGPIVRRKDRNAGVITDEEWAEGVEDHDDTRGRSFRRWLLVIISLCVVFLAWCKYDIEEGISLPPEMLKLAQRDAELRGESTKGAKSTKDKDAQPAAEQPAPAADAQATAEGLGQATEAELEEYYKLLDVDKLAQLNPDEIEARARQDLEKRRAAAGEGEREKFEGEEALRQSRQEALRQARLDIWRQKEEMKRKFNARQEEFGQLVHCGRKCESEHKQIQLAYDTLNGQVDRELFGVLLDEDVTSSGRKSADVETLKHAYETKKQTLEADEKLDDEVRSMELAEIKDAYHILVNPETRAYYQMFGRKPPEHMKKTSTKHGGWGQELLLRTHKNRLILAWLDYFSTGWADWTVLGVIGFFGFVLPIAVQFPRILEMAREIEERQNQMDELERRAKDGGSAADPPAAAAASGAAPAA